MIKIADTLYNTCYTTYFVRPNRLKPPLYSPVPLCDRSKRKKKNFRGNNEVK